MKNGVVVFTQPWIFAVGCLGFLALMAVPVGMLYSLNHKGITMDKAVAIGDVDHVREIIRNNPEEANRPDVDGNRPLHIAAANGHIAVINALVQAGADMLAVNRYGDDPFEIARLMGHKEAYNFLLSCFWQRQEKERKRRHPPKFLVLRLRSRDSEASFFGHQSVSLLVHMLGK